VTDASLPPGPHGGAAAMGAPAAAGAVDGVAARAGVVRSNWAEATAMLPDVLRLLRVLAVDPRVPRRAKLLAAAATAYVVVPFRPLPDVVPGTGIGLDDLVAIVWAVRRLIAAAGYDLVRELWTGTDAAFALLIVLAGVDA
jgi:uncharacterized membrane protein YkvA (DUF1232 family)